MDNITQKLMYLAIWYSMPEEHLNTIKEAVELLNRPRCILKKCPFLDELTERQEKIVRCKDCRKHNVSVGYKKDCCPLYEFRGISYGHEHDYQFCCFAERRTDE